MKKIMQILGSILVKSYGRRDFSVKTPAIFALGYLTNAALTLNSDTSNSDEVKQIMAPLEYADESIDELKSDLESIKETQKEIRKRQDDLKQLIEESNSGVLLEEMDQKGRADLVQTAENEGRVWDL